MKHSRSDSSAALSAADIAKKIVLTAKTKSLQAWIDAGRVTMVFLLHRDCTSSIERFRDDQTLTPQAQQLAANTVIVTKDELQKLITPTLWSRTLHEAPQADSWQ